MARLRINPLTGLFDYSPVIPPDYVSSVADTATIDLDVTAAGVLTANLISLTGFDTGDLAEGSNLYFTTARARLSISATSPVFYDNGTGEISLGVVPISLGGTGQSNVQAAINSLTNNSMTANDGDFFLWSGGNAQFVAPSSIPGLSGDPNELAFYNSSGNLDSLGNWQVLDDGRIGGYVNVIGNGWQVFRTNASLNALDVANDFSLFSGNLLNDGTLTGYVSLLNLNYGNGLGTTDSVNGINIGAQVNVTNLKQMGQFYSSGTAGGFGGLYFDIEDVVSGNSNVIGVSVEGDVTGQLSMFNAFLQSGFTAGSYRGIDLGINGDVSGFASFLGFNSAGVITKGLDILSANISGNVGDGTGVNINGVNLSIQNTATVDGGIVGLNLNNSAAIVSNDTFYGANIYNQGTGYRYHGFSSNNNANQAEEIRGFQHSTTGDSRTSTGIDVYMQGNATDDAQGIRVNVSNQTSTNQRVRSIDAQGATYSYNGVFRPASGTFVDSGNNNFLEFRVANGSPLTGTDAFSNGNIVAYLVQDDVALGPVGLGQVHSSAVSLLGVATGKTMDLHRGILVAASVQNPGYADAGAVTEYQGIVYAGALPSGGSTTIGTASGLIMPAGFDSYATNNWGVRVEGTTAQNYLNKLALGTPSFGVVGSYLLQANGAVHAQDYYSADESQGATASPAGLVFKNGLYISGSGPSASGNVDGGTASSIYGGSTTIDGGNA